MRTEWLRLNEAERSAFSVVTAFIHDRLAAVETINWALGLGSGESVKRAAVLQLVDSPAGRKLAEPWRTAWRMIEEYWDTPSLGHRGSINPYHIGERVKSGDRSGSLVSMIVESVAPRLRLSAMRQWRPEGRTRIVKRPRTIAQLLSVGIASGPVMDPHILGLDEVEEDAFLIALAIELEGALSRGLDTARRLGWDGEHRLYRIGQLHRVYFVPTAERKPGEHEPDEFHEGIAPCIKLLHSAVAVLAKHRATAAREIVARWKLTPSPFHARLWAALGRDPWVASASEVNNFITALDGRRFWDVQNFPEISELRAVRFGEFDMPAQRALISRLRKPPPRSLWPRAIGPARLARARYWRVRELRRIEVAGAPLPTDTEAWLQSQIALFPDLAQMSRIDDGFMASPKGQYVPPNPDQRYDALAGNERLFALEAALSSVRRGWDDDPSGRAWDWMRQPGNASALIRDLEASADTGATFPRLWERFGWAHTRDDGQKSTRPEEELMSEAARVLALLQRLPEATIRQAIEGISQWMSTWESSLVKLPAGFVVWQRLWPLAVEATNAAQPVDAAIDLNLLARGSDDHEPMDLDTLNTPAGRLTGVFLKACPAIHGQERPFADGILSSMRDTIIATGGRSGLIVRHRLIEALGYFLRADPEWTERHLIAPLLQDSTDAIGLWRALARRRQALLPNMPREVAAAMVTRATDLRLGRETRRSLVFALVVECLHALNGNRAPVVSHSDVQQMIRALEDELRAFAAGVIQQFVREMSAPHGADESGPTPEDLFDRAAAPFLRDVWPQERSLSTPGVSTALADLPATSRGAFARAVDMIQRFLVPFDCWSLHDFGLSDHGNDESRLSEIGDPEKAAALLRLLGSTIGTAESAVIPFGLGNALAQIETVTPGLASDPVYRRLAAAARRE
jgi:hypothetical protein